MQRLGLSQSLQQKLSPQQIQFIKLLQIPTAELDSRIEEELEINPALEEGKEEEEKDEVNVDGELDDPFESENEEGEDAEPGDDYEDEVIAAEEYSAEEFGDDINVEEYVGDDDIAGYKMQGDGPSKDEEERESPMVTET